MDGLLFDPIEYTDPGIRAVMDGKTCRQCEHRHAWQSHFYGKHTQICMVRKSGRTKSGQLRVRCDQPACILFTHRNTAK